MNRITIIGLLLVLLIVSSLAHDNFYTAGMISGTYIYEFPNSITEGPSRGHQLTLKRTGQFESDTWGNGNFEIHGAHLILSYTVAPEEINFKLKDSIVTAKTEGEKASIEFILYRPFFWGTPRIRVDASTGYYYKKFPRRGSCPHQPQGAAAVQ